jgi:hypothetical protein
VLGAVADHPCTTMHVQDSRRRRDSDWAVDPGQERLAGGTLVLDVFDADLKRLLERNEYAGPHADVSYHVSRSGRARTAALKVGLSLSD